MSGSSYFKDYTAHQNATILVSSTEELNAAVAELAGTTGGTVLLSGEAGPYRLDARNLGDSAESAVLITSQDSNNPAQLKQVYIDNSVYLSLTDVTIDSGDYGFERSGHLHDIYVKSGAHLQFVDLTMTSTAEAPLGFDDDTVKAEDAVYLRNASDVLFADSTISNYYHGISLAGVRDTIVTGNDISALQGDGIRGGGVNNVLVSDNHIHDFLGATNEYNHPDMIQFWTGFPEGMTNTDLTITGNLLNAGEGSAAQGILVQNEAFDDAGDPLEGVYGQNLTITDNVIHSGMSNGIGIIGYQGVEVANNSVLWNEGAVLSQTADAVPASNPPWILVRNSLEVETAGNVAHLVRIETEDQAETNYFLDYDNPSAPNYAYAHVIGLAADGQTDVYDLQFRPDSPLNGVSGAEASTWTPSEAPVNAVISQQPSLEDRAAVELSARYSTVDGQLVDPETAQVFWTLADGTVLEGLEVTVTFDTPGLHEVTLDVLAPDGSSDSATRSVDIRGNGLFEADFARSETFGDGVEIVDPNGEAFSKKGVFTLDGDSVFEVTRGNPEFETLHTLSMDVSFKPDAFEKNGWLVKWLKAVDLRVTDEKGLWLKIETDADVYEIRTEGNLLEKGEWADIAVDFDSHAGQMRLSLDGEELGRTDVEGTISGSQYDLTLGEGRGRSAEGEIDYFSMTTPPAGSVLEIGDRFPEEPEEPEELEPPVSEEEPEEPVAPSVAEEEEPEGVLIQRFLESFFAFFGGRQATEDPAPALQDDTGTITLENVSTFFREDLAEQRIPPDEEDPAEDENDFLAA
ncbi:parallel beta-helix repeat protein (plasmid) [Dinoroseobacter shibae DFL 12 = DSM 16493]|uniref:Parallel beta-helix repeat protein n=1 Tax=Dinoroseobacter shibae (strain DSM 16493 / NCIMB 14021 / DFL 12) TaxID=398580 RepID=A8LUC6_DINSH|nr:right-handed parallel beta-helix repeat-containing protein [Dinoroseobacter shibae]ABV95843.1 parallel beta-helix repeat protein [Dinoroseobacter shibae DFL 12 = DSM 16493]URF49089.1 right-handed parallel beta-helix repeat-containing protein [Dinoroseobacter shibae]URF53398.1 right-handed parallel beta-helix repeat-containing protein [Dinoroseobacter shibae]